MSLWLLNDVWLNWSEALDELTKADLGISVKVKSAHDGNELGLHWLMTDSLKEASERRLFNDLVVQVVDSLETVAQVEGLVSLKLLLKLL